MGHLGPVALVCGLKREAKSINRAAGAHLTVCVAGPGASDAFALLRSLKLRGFQFVVSAGIAGGLSPSLPSGSLLVPHSVLRSDNEGSYLETPVDARWRERLLKRLNADEHKSGQTIIWQEKAALTVEEKARLHARTGAGAVDMESGSLAAAAELHGLAFAVVRAVADDAGREVPAAAARLLKRTGGIALTRLASGIVSRKLTISDLAALRRDSDRAIATLSKAIECLAPDFCAS